MTEETTSNLTPLTPDDYVEIQQLLARYAYALDTGADNGYMYADLFAEDGTAFNVTGRDNLARLALSEPHGANVVRHFPMPAVISPSAEGATGIQYLLVIETAAHIECPSIPIIGRYEDCFVRTAIGWRFRSRTLVRAAAQNVAR